MVIFILLVLAFAAFAQMPRSVQDGVYTQEQADRGKAAYAEQCASCHGAGLNGGQETPALTGGAFLVKWQNRSVNELFESIRVSMPADRPGSLSRQKYSDILAYVLAANKFPAGSAELGTQSEALKQISFQTRRASGAQTASTGPATAGTRPLSNASNAAQ
ncbi:MAG TPA: cytochrome c, partial [Bryobacteraceae bacterium]|nr:cytochrome c [Bryobacteraceae bacterium]